MKKAVPEKLVLEKPLQRHQKSTATKTVGNLENICQVEKAKGKNHQEPNETVPKMEQPVSKGRRTFCARELECESAFLVDYFIVGIDFSGSHISKQVPVDR